MWLLAIVMALATVACANSPPTPGTDALRRTCFLGDVEGSADTAVSCAELFIARNGYTLSETAAEPNAFVAESIEPGTTVSDILAARRGTLNSKAFAVCSDPSGYGVLFRYAKGGHNEACRVVRMSRQYNKLQLEHQDMLVAELKEPSCRVL